MFKSVPQNLQRIVDICSNADIELSGTIFFTNPDNLQDNIDYVRETYGAQYVRRMIVCQNPERIRTILPYFAEQGYIEGLLGKSASVLSFMLDEIKEREEVIKRSGQEVLVNGNFNPIFGQTRKIYNEKHAEVISAIRAEAGVGASHK